jgi:3-deoxy-D-manno-octulosonate 8-phosphate phosphatase (KDO 8-P phosphatase)
VSVQAWSPRSDEDYRREAAEMLGAELTARFARVAAVVLDADGVLTSGNLIYGPEGEVLKEFDTRDGLGLVLAREAGLPVAVLTGRPSEIVGRRARELGFAAIKLGRYDKLDALAEIAAEVGIPPEDMLYVGDDLVDLPALCRVGVPVSVPAAPAEVRACCCYVTRAPGGRGAVREVLELVLKCRGLWGAALRGLAEASRPGRGGGTT